MGGVIIRLVAPLAAVLALTGCAGTTFHVVHNDLKDKGIRYPRYSTYLMVYTDNDGSLKSDIYRLPDRNRLMSVRPWAFMASNETSLTFKDGVLDSGATTLDTTKVPAAVIDAVKQLAMEAVKAGNIPGTGGNGEAYLPSPILFKIMVAGDEISLVTSGSNPTTIKYKPAV